MGNKIKVVKLEDCYAVVLDKNRIVRCERQKDIGKELLDFMIEQCPHTYKKHMKKSFLTQKQVSQKTQPNQYIRLCNSKYVSMANNFNTFKRSFVNLGQRLGIDIEFMV